VGQVSGEADAGTLESGGDIQATTKVVDCRSLKSSPPNFQRVSTNFFRAAHAIVNNVRGILENRGVLSSNATASARAMREIREQKREPFQKNFFSERGERRGRSATQNHALWPARVSWENHGFPRAAVARARIRRGSLATRKARRHVGSIVLVRRRA
jgi:hypothetical protein